MKKEYEPDDPMEMIAVELPCDNEQQLKDMALCFAEEFVRMGWDEERIFKIFKSPVYHGPYMVWKQKGDEFIRAVIGEAYKMWHPLRRRS